MKNIFRKLFIGLSLWIFSFVSIAYSIWWGWINVNPWGISGNFIFPNDNWITQICTSTWANCVSLTWATAWWDMTKAVYDPQTIAWDAFNRSKHTWNDYAQEIVVALTWADFTSIQSAIDSITDASASKPYLISVKPWIYTENIVMKNYIELEWEWTTAIIRATTWTLLTLPNTFTSIRKLQFELLPTWTGTKMIDATAWWFHDLFLHTWIISSSTTWITATFAELENTNIVFSDTFILYSMTWDDWATSTNTHTPILLNTWAILDLFRTTYVSTIWDETDNFIWIDDNSTWRNLMSKVQTIFTATNPNYSWRFDWFKYRKKPTIIWDKLSDSGIYQLLWTWATSTWSMFTIDTDTNDAIIISQWTRLLVQDFWTNYHTDIATWDSLNSDFDSVTAIDWNTWAWDLNKIVEEMGNFVVNTDIIDEWLYIGNATNNTLRENFNTTWSAGWGSWWVITELWTWAFLISAWNWKIRSSDSENATIFSFDWNAFTWSTITWNTVVYVDYNWGNPLVTTWTNRNINNNSQFILYEIEKESDWTLHISDRKLKSINVPALIQERLYEETPIKITSWIVLSASWRNIVTSAWKIWRWLISSDISACSSATTNIDAYYYNWSNWIKVASQSEWDNAQYNNITSWLTALWTAKWGNHDIYINWDWKKVLLYWQWNFWSQSEAESASRSSIIPWRLLYNSTWVWRYVFQKNDTVPVSVIWREADPWSAITTDHNNLWWLQGWQATEFYHLTNAEHTVSTQPASNTVSWFVNTVAQTFSWAKTFLWDLTVLWNTIFSWSWYITEAETMNIAQKDITLWVGSPSDTFIDWWWLLWSWSTLKSIIWDNTTDSFIPNQHWNLETWLEYKINNVSVLNATTLWSSVINSSLTNVWTLQALTVTWAVIFQTATDTVTWFQVLDSDWWDPILVVDTINERVWIWKLPSSWFRLDINWNLRTIWNADEVQFIVKWNATQTTDILQAQNSTWDILWWVNLDWSLFWNLWTSISNTLFWINAGVSITSGIDNVIIWWDAWDVLVVASQNTAIWKHALGWNISSAWNTAIWYRAWGSTQGWANVFIWREAWRNGSQIGSSVIIGAQAWDSMNWVSQANILIGFSAWTNITATIWNVLIGDEAGAVITTWTGNVLLGYEVWKTATSLWATDSNKLLIDNSDNWSPLIYWEFDNNLVRINWDLDITWNLSIDWITTTGSILYQTWWTLQALAPWGSWQILTLNSSLIPFWGTWASWWGFVWGGSITKSAVSSDGITINNDNDKFDEWGVKVNLSNAGGAGRRTGWVFIDMNNPGGSYYDIQGASFGLGAGSHIRLAGISVGRVAYSGYLDSNAAFARDFGLLSNLEVSNTQSNGAVISKINLGTSAQAHTALLAECKWANTSQTCFKADLWTWWTWKWIEVIKNGSTLFVVKGDTWRVWIWTNSPDAPLEVVWTSWIKIEQSDWTWIWLDINYPTWLWVWTLLKFQAHNNFLWKIIDWNVLLRTNNNVTLVDFWIVWSEFSGTTRTNEAFNFSYSRWNNNNASDNYDTVNINRTTNASWGNQEWSVLKVSNVTTSSPTDTVTVLELLQDTDSTWDLISAFNWADKVFSVSNSWSVVIGGTSTYTPSSTQTLSAGDTLTITKKTMIVKGNGAVTLTSTPHFTACTVGGQELTIMGDDDTNTLTLQDESSLAGSKVQMNGGTNCVLGNGDIISFICKVSDATWYASSECWNN